MTRKDLGPNPVGDTDQLTLGWARTTYPSYSNYAETDADYHISLPDDPVEHQMEIYEIKAGDNRILVFSPGNVLACQGTSLNITLEPNKTGFLGYRWSDHAQSWFLLSTAIQN